MTQRLNQVLAVEKATKTRANDAVTALYKSVQKPGLFDGFTKRYQPRTEEDEKIPDESQRVQMTAPDVLSDVGRHLASLFEVEASKDYANCSARADVVVGEEKVLTNVPATFLLFLDKQLTDLRTLVAAMPTLDPAHAWERDANQRGIFRAAATQTSKTKKAQKGIVLYDATEHHPAQTQLITEDIVVGHWTTEKLSGALPVPEKVKLLGRIEALQAGVKRAREQANLVDAPEVGAGAVLSWVFKE